MKHKHSHKSITIGPYTNAAALREIQKLIEEKFARGELEYVDDQNVYNF